MAKKRKRVAKKNMEEKGISPLIATVLLIGFTVALAAIIITWGGRFIGTTTERVDCDTKARLTCTNDVNLEVTGVSDCSAGSAKIRVDNRANTAIESLNFRIYYDGGNVYSSGDWDLDMTNPDSDPLGAFAVKDYEITGITPVGIVSKVEAIPKIKIEKCASVSCGEIIKSFEPAACTVTTPAT